MSDLILSKHTMSSLEIAELAGKQHNDVLKAIRAMEPAWEKVTEGKFSLSEYRDSTGRALPCYELNACALMDKPVSLSNSVADFSIPCDGV